MSRGVGIETARYGHQVSFLDEQKRSAAKSFHFTESAAGDQQFQDVLQKLAEKHPGVHFHIRRDAAGQSAENLVPWRHRLPFDTTISVGQPARNQAYRQVHFDKRKADPVERLACARFAIVERPAATPHNPPEFQQLRDVVALMESSAKPRTRLINQLQGLLARVFPELAVHVTDLSANGVLSLLEKYPTPDKLARAKPETLIKIPHLAADMAETLRSAAAQSTGSNGGPLAAELIRQKVHALRPEQAAFAALADLVEPAWQALPEGPARRVRTIPGSGLQTSAAPCEIKTVVGHKQAVQPHRKVVTTTDGKISPAPTAINEPAPVPAHAADRLTGSPRRSRRDTLIVPGETESSSAGPCSARCPQLDKG